MAKDPHKSLDLDKPANSGDYQRGNNHLLLIGIDAYVHHNRLNNARRDAETMRELLIRHYEFVPERITELYDEDATRRSIIETLEALEERLSPADNLLIYFSGHGTMNRKKSQGFWVPVDAEKTTADYLPNDRVRAIIGDMEAHHIYLIVDACFAGSTILRSETEAHELMEANPSRRALTSGRKEVVSDGKAGGHSPFFDCIRHQLGQGLLLSAVELESYVIHNTPRTAHQLPEADFIFGLGDKSGKFVFHPKRNQQADYEAAQQTNTSQSWTTFLQAYPDFTPKSDIETRIAHLQEQEAWAKATSRNSISAYQVYRKDFPQGAHRSEALDRIGQLEADRDWKRVQRQGTIMAYERFLDRHPNCQQRPEAEAAIEGLLKREQEAEQRQQAEATRQQEAERSRAAEEEKTRRQEQARLAEEAHRKETERLAAERAKRERQAHQVERKRKDEQAAQARIAEAGKQQEAEKAVRQEAERNKKDAPIWYQLPLIRVAMIALPVLLLAIWGIYKLIEGSGNSHKINVQVEDAPQLSSEIPSVFLAQIPDGFEVINIREGQGTDTDILGMVKAGQLFLVKSDSSTSWWEITTSDDRKGYMHNSKINRLRPARESDLAHFPAFEPLPPQTDSTFSAVSNLKSRPTQGHSTRSQSALEPQAVSPDIQVSEQEVERLLNKVADPKNSRSLRQEAVDKLKPLFKRQTPVFERTTQGRRRSGYKEVEFYLLELKLTGNYKISIVKIQKENGKISLLEVSHQRR